MAKLNKTSDESRSAVFKVPSETGKKNVVMIITVVENVGSVTISMIYKGRQKRLHHSTPLMCLFVMPTCSVDVHRGS